MIKIESLLFENAFKLISTKPPQVFGMRKAVYKSKDGTTVSVVHSDYSRSMRTGSALNGYSSVWEGNNFIDDVEFKGENHVEKATKYLLKKYGITHDVSKLKKYQSK
jgi:hypothetical protein